MLSVQTYWGFSEITGTEESLEVRVTANVSGEIPWNS